MSRKQQFEAYQSNLVDIGFTADEARHIMMVRAADDLQRGRPNEPLQFRLEKKEDDALEVSIYGTIGFDFFEGGFTPDKLTEQLKAAGKVSQINVYINSGGGDAFDGVTLHSILRRQQAKVSVYVDGLAASAATIVASAADPGELRIAAGGMWMAHRAWGVAVGNTKDMADYAVLLEKLDGRIAGIYAARSGRRPETFLKIMDAETWMTGEEAIAEKMVDSVVAGKKAAACANPALLLRYRNLPESLKAEAVPPPDPRPSRDAVATRLKLLELDEVA